MSGAVKRGRREYTSAEVRQALEASLIEKEIPFSKVDVIIANEFKHERYNALCYVWDADTKVGARAWGIRMPDIPDEGLPPLPEDQPASKTKRGR